MEGSYELQQWNHSSHEGQRTNNHSEGYNNRLSKKIPRHPNPYQWVQTIKDELKSSMTDALACQVGNTNSRRNPRKTTVAAEQTRVELLDKLRKNLIPLSTYQQAVGGNISVATKASNAADDEGDLFFNLESGEEDVTIEVPEISEIIVRGLVEIQETSNSDEVDSNSEQAPAADRVLQVLSPVEVLVNQSEPEPQAQVPSQQIQPAPASARGRGRGGRGGRGRRGRGRGQQIQSRTLSVQQKRMSELSDSIVGQELREKRRRLNGVAEDVVAVRFDSGMLFNDPVILDEALATPPILVDSNYEVLAPPPPPPARKRGRPKGSKNKPKHPELRPSTAALISDDSIDER